MENTQIKKKKLRQKRKVRVRSRLRGNGEKPRMCVIKTNQHIHVQLIDDEKAHTLASISTLSKDFRKTEFNQKKCLSGKELGLKIAELAKTKNLKRAVLDRGCFRYHGVIAAVADGAREGGLEL